jgi:hypothetical protein
VADQIPSAIRTTLNEAAIGWLDRRGHLRLTGEGVYLDADVPRLSRKAPQSGIERDPIKGRSGLAAAAALLFRPDDPMGVSEIARVAELNPSSITRAMTSLASANLAERHGRGRYRALVPELFWALADVWPRESEVLELNQPSLEQDRLGMNTSHPDEVGWSVAGERGAVAWGAPLVLTADYPIVFYVPNMQSTRVAKLLAAEGSVSGSRSGAKSRSESGSRSGSRSRSAAGLDARAAIRLAVDPIGLVTMRRHLAPGYHWPLAHPLFCALDLTASSRDREALGQWTPPEGFTRVW